MKSLCSVVNLITRGVLVVVVLGSFFHFGIGVIVIGKDVEFPYPNTRLGL